MMACFEMGKNYWGTSASSKLKNELVDEFNSCLDSQNALFIKAKQTLKWI